MLLLKFFIDSYYGCWGYIMSKAPVFLLVGHGIVSAKKTIMKVMYSNLHVSIP